MKFTIQTIPLWWFFILLLTQQASSSLVPPLPCQGSSTWSSIVISDNTEARPDKPCNSFVSEYGCRFRNACCWNNAKLTCGPSNFNLVECPLRTTLQQCSDLIASPYCWWDGTICRRRCPQTSNPDELCAELATFSFSPSHSPTPRTRAPSHPTTHTPSTSPTPSPSTSPSLSPTTSPITLDRVLEVNSLIDVRCTRDDDCDGYPNHVCFTDSSTRGWLARLLEDRVNISLDSPGFCGCSRYWGKSGRDCDKPTSSLYYDLFLQLIMLIVMVPVAYSCSIDCFARFVCDWTQADNVARLFQCLGALLFVSWKISELSTLVSNVPTQLAEVIAINVLAGISLTLMFAAMVNVIGEWRVQVDLADPIVQGTTITEHGIFPTVILIIPIVPMSCAIVYWPSLYELWIFVGFGLTCIVLGHNTTKHVDDTIQVAPIAQYELSRIKKYAVGVTRCLELTCFLAVLGIITSFLISDSLHDVSYQVRAAYFLTRHAEMFFVVSFGFSHRYLHLNVVYVFFDI